MVRVSTPYRSGSGVNSDESGAVGVTARKRIGVAAAKGHDAIMNEKLQKLVDEMVDRGVRFQEATENSSAGLSRVCWLADWS